MSDTKRADRAERADDMRGNREPLFGAADDPGAGDDWSPGDFVAGEYLPELPPSRDRERNAVVIRALSIVLYERGHMTLHALVRSTVDAPAYDVDDEIFDLLVVLSGDYTPRDVFATAERNALLESLPREALDDARLAEFCDDAMMCMGTGEPIEEATYFLLGEREGEGEWDEMRVSFRVAVELGRVEQARARESSQSFDARSAH